MDFPPHQPRPSASPDGAVGARRSYATARNNSSEEFFNTAAKIELLLICSKIPKLDKKAIDAIVNKRLTAQDLGKLCVDRDTDPRLLNELNPFLEKILNATEAVAQSAKVKKLDQDAMRQFGISI